MILFYFILAFVFVRCNTVENTRPIKQKFEKYITTKNGNSDIKNNYWYYKDIQKDTVPGLSLERAKEKFLSDKKGKPVIVAVIDGRFDINHPDLKQYLWINSSERLNYLDDDGNGYVDDMYGWNFMGNEMGQSAQSVNQEYVRIVKLFENRFKNKTFSQLNEGEKNEFRLYQKAKLKLDQERIDAKYYLKRSYEYYNKYIAARKALKSWFPDYKYDMETLKNIDTVKNPSLIPHVKEIAEVIAWKETDELKHSTLRSRKERLNKILNPEFNDRELVGDNPYDINDTIYGNNKVNAYSNFYDHGTRVFGTIADVFDQVNSHENFKILPLSKSPSGDYYDKDVALAIRYAVNKGARVINMSFGKAFSLNNQWVTNAMKYAERNDVLLVCSAGNSAENIDEIFQYPSDHDEIGKELLNNVLTVGASGKEISKSLKTNFSNYGANNVDVFAPGEDIRTPFPNHNRYGFPPQYDSDAGTSLSAALTSGVAALIFSYYPNLTAKEVKQILMDSGIEYTFPVKISDDQENDNLLPFNKLSKSGKIINVYNAFLLAESYSKQ